MAELTPRHRDADRSRRATTRSSSSAAAPGAIQVAYSLRAARHRPRRHLAPTRRRAGCSAAGRSSSGCCRGPSRTRPVEHGEPGLRALRLEQPARRRPGTPLPHAGPHGRDVVLPVAAGDGAEPRDVRRAARARGSATTAAGPATRREDGRTASGSSSRRRTASTAAGSRSSPSASPSRTRPPTPGIELTAHYADTRPAETYAGRRIFIMGKQNSGFELAIRPAAVGAPDRPRLARRRRSCRSTRSRWSASGRAMSSRSRTTSSAAAWPSSTRRSAGSSGPRARDVRRPGPAVGGRRRAGDRGRRGHLRDRLRDAAPGPAGPRRRDVRPEPRCRPRRRTGRARRCPGIFFAGHDRAGLRRAQEARPAGQLRGGPRRALQRPGPRRPHRPDASSARAPSGRRSRRTTSLARSSRSSPAAPELWHQRAYLARVISLDPADGPRDEGIVPLAAFVDGLGDDGTADALALTLEADGTGRDLSGRLPPP